VGKSLVIVESPTKAKTIAGFLPKGFMVESSLGHIRDLPPSAKEIPAEVKKEEWGRLGIDVQNDFKPVYVIPSKKKQQVAKLKGLLKEATTLYLATDEDREGESISWHLLEVLKPKVPRKRLVFHEITREAIEKALENPRDIDERLVEAQETRRIVDRLYGYEISPVLWKKIAPRLSAGRVQSVAVRIIVERERQRQRFVRSTYWDILGLFRTREGADLPAALVSLDGKRVASGDDFDKATGKLKDTFTDGRAPVLVTEAMARDLAGRLRSDEWSVVKVERKPFVWKPPAPFTTSTLQQEANRKFRLTSRDTMRAAQRLYENGLITYMRTDSTTLSESAVRSARDLIGRRYGEKFLSPEPRQYATKVKNAQEAHEAIRPSGDFQLPEELRGEVSEIERKVYELIWMRMMACQMADARGHHLVVEVANKGGEKREIAVFRANGKAIEFPGYLRAYVEGADDPDQELADKETLLPDVSTGDPMDCSKLEPKTHTTSPPPRYTEASLVKELEANGIGRPSTYATIIDTILQREYVVKEGNSLVPTFMAFAVVGLLEKNFEELVDIEFTARMENELDAISLGEEKQLPYLKSFYFGRDGKPGLKPLVEKDIDARESCTLPLGKDSEGRAVNVRIGRYGPYLERDEERTSIPAGIAPDELTLEKAVDLLEKGAGGPRKLGVEPSSGKEIFVKVGRFGPYVQLGEAAGNGEKPRMKSLLPGMDPETVGLEDALKLLALPRSLGVDPETGVEVFADFGRYGPYVKRGDDTRSLPKDANIFDVTLERAIQSLKEEKKGPSWRSRGPTVLRELGVSTVTGAPVKLLAGRYGPYVTDGTTNASIPRDAKPEEVTLEQAIELLRARAAAGPPKKGGRFAKKSAGGASGGKKKQGAAPAANSPAAEAESPAAEAKPAGRGKKKGGSAESSAPQKPGKPAGKKTAGKSRKKVG